jgi:hypothetical protein
VTTAPETPSAPVDGGNLIADATQAYERYEFPVSDAPETAPEKTAPSEPTPQEPAPAAPAPEAKAPEPGELTDEELERVLRHPKGQDRLDRLVNNKLGNRLQQEREAQAKDAKEWDAATSYFQRLTDDDDFYEAEVGKHGEAVVLRYRADYQDAKQARDTKSATPVVDDVAARAEWTQAFNSAAVSEFKDIVKATLPFYGDLPPEVRTAVENASYNPEGNWLGDALTAIGKGVVKHIEGLERRQTAALREATTAGKNDAIAAREDAAPVVVDGSPGTDWNDIYRRYGEGDPKVSRDEFHRALKALGKDF